VLESKEFRCRLTNKRMHAEDCEAIQLIGCCDAATEGAISFEFLRSTTKLSVFTVRLRDERCKAETLIKRLLSVLLTQSPSILYRLKPE